MKHFRLKASAEFEGRTLGSASAACAGLVLSSCAWLSSPAPPCSVLAEFGARQEDERCVIAGLNTAAYSGERLPDNLTVRGDLQIYGQRLDALPRGLVVEGKLDLYKASYQLPDDLVVHGDVDSTLGFGDRLLRCAEIPKTARLGGSVRCE